ncbi:conserved hypothetical protein [Xenorhabdus bovienii str. Intermedium]|uniref:Uncharacterized protein n=2 Tax=Xenorhabdus bovienii TaxID=40576 RepID=A0A077QKU7_XENBV|nr:conserved hypothetical protein [Xenorhabdus bovienii str. Intermedium]
MPEKSMSKSKTVSVRLNHPHGIAFPMPDDTNVVLKGNAFHLFGMEKGTLPVGLYGETMVDADKWDYILKTYGEMEIFKNNLCIWDEKAPSANDKASEKKELRHGREPVDTSKTTTEPAKETA